MKQTARILGTPRQPMQIRRVLLALRTGTLAAAVTGASLLTGCGLKGPLYLPTPGTNTPSAASAPITP